MSLVGTRTAYGYVSKLRSVRSRDLPYPAMILVLKIAAFTFLAGAGLAYWLCHRAPEGQQDSRGFRPQVDEGAES